MLYITGCMAEAGGGLGRWKKSFNILWGKVWILWKSPSRVYKDDKGGERQAVSLEPWVGGCLVRTDSLRRRMTCTHVPDATVRRTLICTQSTKNNRRFYVKYYFGVSGKERNMMQVENFLLQTYLLKSIFMNFGAKKKESLLRLKWLLYFTSQMIIFTHLHCCYVY